MWHRDLPPSTSEPEGAAAADRLELAGFRLPERRRRPPSVAPWLYSAMARISRDRDDVHIALLRGVNVGGAKQVKMLEKKLNSNRGKLSEEMSHEIRQKLAILKSFTAPKELSPNDERQIYFHAMLHIGLIVATFLLFVTPRDDSDGDDTDDGGEKAINDVPIIAKPVD